MATVRQEFSEHVLREYSERGMLAWVADGYARRSLLVLAKPDIGEHKVPLSFHRPDWTVEPTLWYGKWWARLLRRVDRGLRHWGWCLPRLNGRLRRLKLRFPSWLTSLLYSKSVTLCAKVERLPLDALERIAVMANYLKFHEGIEPTKVLLGRKAFFEIQQQHCMEYGLFGPDGLTFSQNPYDLQILGLSAQISPFLVEDEILVV